MSVSAEANASIIKKFQRKEGDTGSPEVQIALITEQINSLTVHMKKHKKDFHSRRGLMALVNRRRSLLTYLKRKSKATYSSLVQALGLRT